MLLLLQKQHGYIDFNSIKENGNKTHLEKLTINMLTAVTFQQKCTDEIKQVRMLE